ncbi:MAG: GNAT family N-acetyltransferase [Anaerolineae bacterium]|nr:GNAT family N-acetyltransferase [Anaerolineae bacterium]
MVIRKATLDDYDELCGLIAEVDELHRINLPQRFREPEGPTREWDYLRSVITDENVGFFVAEDDGELVGFVHVVVRDSRDIPILVPRRYAFIDSIAVREELRGTGIGRVLMERAHEWATSMGATEMELNVFEFNEDAVAFYLKLGYRTVCREMSKPLQRREERD